MMASTANSVDPAKIDPLRYLETYIEDFTSRSKCLEYYHVLQQALLRPQGEDVVAFDLAVKEIGEKLGIKAKVVKDDLSRLAEPPAAKDARELLEKIGQTRMLRLAQDYQDSKLWFGIVAREEKLLVNSERALLTLDQVPEGLIVKDHGFDLCRFSKDGHRALCERWGGSRLYVAS